MAHVLSSADHNSGSLGGLESLPYVLTFPQALGTGIIINTAKRVPAKVRKRMADLIEDYESALSRFRTDSLLAAMAKADNGGEFVFPSYCCPLFEMYDRFYALTEGRLDPAVGADLVALGYGPDMSFVMQAGALGKLGRIHGRPTWAHDVRRNGATLITAGPIHLDFGAMGKGFLVDLLGAFLADAGEYVIDAGGDMGVRTPTPITVAMEDPCDQANAVGVVSLSSGALCASAPSRRHWTSRYEREGEAGLISLHHILNAIDGTPVQQVLATWALVGSGSFPVAVADGLATALFLMDPSDLAFHVDYSCAVLRSDRRFIVSSAFPGEVFTNLDSHPIALR